MLTLRSILIRDEESERKHREGWQASFDNLDRVLTE